MLKTIDINKPLFNKTILLVNKTLNSNSKLKVQGYTQYRVLQRTNRSNIGNLYKVGRARNKRNIEVGGLIVKELEWGRAKNLSHPSPTTTTYHFRYRDQKLSEARSLSLCLYVVYSLTLYQVNYRGPQKGPLVINNIYVYYIAVINILQTSY